MSVEHYENFPVASVLCPPHLRPAVQAIYWFARTADDLADEGDTPAAQRLADLAAYRADLHAMAAQLSPPARSARWPGVFDRLLAPYVDHKLPLHLLDALLSAFEQDVRQRRYATRAEVLDYCNRSANPVGRLLLHLYGVTDGVSLEQSDAICSALQLINFWQDLSVDLSRDRLYIPLEALSRHALSVDTVLARIDTPATRALVAEQAAWARDLMLQGAPLVHRLPGRAGWELRLVVQGGLCILDKLAALDHASMRTRPTVGAKDAPTLLWRAIRMRSRTPPMVQRAVS